MEQYLEYPLEPKQIHWQEQGRGIQWVSHTSYLQRGSSIQACG